MEYDESDWFEISALNRFLFCPRHFGLSVIERQWNENVYTVTGTLLHGRAHDDGLRESRGDKVVTHAMRVFHPELGVTGECDVVEFVRSGSGVPLAGKEGLWAVCPVEYKKSVRMPVPGNAAAQLCCQAMCLEFMLCTRIPEGVLYDIEHRRRHSVVFTDELRGLVVSSLAQMHALYDRRHTPAAKPRKACSGCSLFDACMPGLSGKEPVGRYVDRYVGDME